MGLTESELARTRPLEAIPTPHALLHSLIPNAFGAQVLKYYGVFIREEKRKKGEGKGKREKGRGKEREREEGREKGKGERKGKRGKVREKGKGKKEEKRWKRKGISGGTGP